jgi:hypothetical protein
MASCLFYPIPDTQYPLRMAHQLSSNWLLQSYHMFRSIEKHVTWSNMFRKHCTPEFLEVHKTLWHIKRL